MNILTAAKDFFLAAPKVATDVFDKDDGLLAKAGGFINDLHYSDVEKARDISQLCKDVSEHVKTTLAESTERSLTRRNIAVLWVKAQLALIFMVAICIPFDKTLAKSYYELATSDVMFYGTGAIIIFFFGSYIYGIKTNQKY